MVSIRLLSRDESVSEVTKIVAMSIDLEHSLETIDLTRFERAVDNI